MSDENVCFICLEYVNDKMKDVLTNVCLCRNSFVHKKCIVEWLKTEPNSLIENNIAKCPICNSPYLFHAGLIHTIMYSTIAKIVLCVSIWLYFDVLLFKAGGEPIWFIYTMLSVPPFILYIEFACNTGCIQKDELNIIMV